MRAWLIVGLATGMAVASLAPGHAEPPEEPWWPPHPTVIMTTYEGVSLPVVGATRLRAQVEFKGKRRTVGANADCFFNRAERFAPGRVEIKDAEATSTWKEHRWHGRRTDEDIHDYGVDYLATFVADRAYRDCYIVIVFFDPDFVAGITDEPGTGYWFHGIGDLQAGRPKKFRFDMGRTVPWELREKVHYFVLVFSGGREIRTNQNEFPAAFFRRLELIAHQRLLVADRARSSRPDRPVQAYLTVAPVLPDGVEQAALPAAVHGILTVGGDGMVQSVDLREPLPEAAAREVRRALRAWLFLPALENGRPVQAKVAAEVELAPAPG